MDRCEECGFAYDLGVAEAEVIGSIRAGVAEVAELLHDPDVELRTRRDSTVWSPLEYGCHLRDMFVVQRERVLAARRTDGRLVCTPMGRDERVEHDGYAEQDPVDVARQLADVAELFVGDLARLGADDWERIVIYTYPTPTERSLHWVAVHTWHEVRHHLMDIRRQQP